MTRSLPNLVRALCCFVLVLGLLIAEFASLHWPLVGDAALMHYVVFLGQHGMAPYRDVVDVNLPGTYFFEATGMAVFGKGAAGWRLYDGFLLLTLLAGCVALGRKLQGWFGGVLAGLLLALIHLQDGIFQVGQRDLLLASLLLWAYVALFEAQTGRRPVLMMGVFGLAIGATATIKPVLVPLGLVLLLLAAWQLRARRTALAAALASGCAGMVAPVAVTFAWLGLVHASAPFWGMTRGLLVLHSQLGKQTLGYLLGHCVSPVGLVVLVWVVLVVVERPAVTPFRVQVYVGLVGTLFAYLVQGKGYPYQRYPLLALLLLVICSDLDRMLDGRGWLRSAAVGVLFVLCLVLGPRYGWTASHFSPAAPFQEALGQRLDSLSRGGGLSVQCLDIFGGCAGVLYDRGIVQSTGFLYDCYLYGAPSPVRDQYRAAFLAAFRAKEPEFVVETNQFCFGTTDGFAKLDRWPEFERELGERYSLDSAWRSGGLQHWWSRWDEPVQFRIYRRR